jgi:hypothetical protein
MLYNSDSHPEVRIPPGVQTRTSRGMQKKFNNGKKRSLFGYLFTSTTYKFEITATVLFTNILPT